MTKLETIEKAIAELSDEERRKLRAFLDELDEQMFDAKIERDAKAGKLDKLEEEALENYRAGKTRPL
jgi:succinate dehydrogenase flavin-adding protein (antitoxin of CptAB toxin-antitoxin module)